MVFIEEVSNLIGNKLIMETTPTDSNLLPTEAIVSFSGSTEDQTLQEQINTTQQNIQAYLDQTYPKNENEILKNVTDSSHTANPETSQDDISLEAALRMSIRLNLRKEIEEKLLECSTIGQDFENRAEKLATQLEIKDEFLAMLEAVNAFVAALSNKANDENLIEKILKTAKHGERDNVSTNAIPPVTFVIIEGETSKSSDTQTNQTEQGLVSP